MTPLARHPLLALTPLYDATAAQALFDTLCAEIPWNDGDYTAAGRRFRLPRLQCWFSDPGATYRYADNLMNSHPWTPTLAALRARVEAVSGVRFNAVLANLYRDGEDAVGWHADDEDDLGPAPHIASLSLGATRRFHWRPKPGVVGEADALPLPAGTLLLMRAPFQQQWEHAVPAEPAVRGARLNLTFRNVVAPA
ncbi:alpha-ketoglutarate-dependent dioxygenase AlkB family protein [Azoarcus olearius]|uniref:DNA repair system specific for alkylated DNA n=1 Tax=Azoarcus sp. (strain BH72) TaxID=418699 RepID=A1K994_AZOSB|nr:alpha-ketoglutarate-dependent dioxygenase AlkB [Azoarcus olearius]ANQ85946.1 DNA repair system specific for alkylated DNA [Azoarcus olearius]CAL95399.1 DNA repair system specific for alkylated DNA [Azoarcus olearius]